MPENSRTASIKKNADSRPLTFLALLVAGTFFMENLDATIITPAIPAMAHDFFVAPADLNLGVSIYMLTLGIFIPVSGWVAERFGARPVFTLAIALFTIASLLCGIAHTFWQFVAFRFLQGIGGAMMVPVGRLVVLHATPKDRLIPVMATLTWPGLVAPVLGPPVGGFLTDHSGWQWIFYLNIPLGVAACALALRLVPSGKTSQERPFDWSGFLLTASGLFCLLYAAECLGHNPVKWDLVGILSAGGILLSGGAVLHFRRSPAPMLTLDALNVPTFAVTIWGGSLFRMGVSAVPFLLPLMLQMGLHYSAWKAGAMLTAVFAGNLVMKPMTTPILQLFGFRPVLLINGILNALTIALCALIGPSLPLYALVLILFLSGMTRSMQFTALNTIAFADIPQEEMPNANTLFSTAFQLALGLGIALGAIAWRLGTFAFPHADALSAFRVAFLIVSAVSLAGVLDTLKLPHDAANHVAHSRKKVS